MSCDPSKICPICDQRGLPILPLRYAVARCDDVVKDKAPKLQAPFGSGVQDIALPSASADYTLRLLRPGYLYVFNEVRGEWKAYVVGDEAYLVEFDIHSKTPPNIQDAEPCERMQNAVSGRCIMIPDAKKAGAVWLGFTDTAWTPAVLEKHRKQAYRERHMQRIDVSAWANAGKSPATQPHLQRMDKLGELVCEFALPGPVVTPVALPKDGIRTLESVVVKPYPAVDYSLHEYHNEQRRTNSFVAATTAAAGEFVPAMVALGDPVGITMELASLPSVLLEDFAANVDPRPLVVSNAIETLRSAIMEDAENRQIYATERAALGVRYGGYGGMGETGARGGEALAESLFPKIKQQRDALYQRMRNPSAEQLKTARHTAWSNYTVKYNEPKRAAWTQQWHDRARTYDQTVIAPLTQRHVAWMRSDALFQKFECNHDDANAYSGLAFTNLFLFCIQDTQKYISCSALYDLWLRALTVEPDNLLLRALTYNQEKTIGALHGSTQGGLQPSMLLGLPWDGLIKAYEEALGSMSEGGVRVVERVMIALGGVIGTRASKAVNELVGPGLVALGAIAKAPVVMVDVTMSKRGAIAELTGRMLAVNPKVGNLKGLNRAIEIQMRKARIYGTPVNGTGRYRYLIMADPQVIADFPGLDQSVLAPDGKLSQARVRAASRAFAEQSLLTESDRMRLTQLRWRGLMPRAAGLGIMSGILQYVALGKLADDLDKSMTHEANENKWRYRAGLTALAGTLSETTGAWLESAAKVGNKLAAFLERYLGQVLRGAGKFLGIGAGLVMAVWDGISGVSEIREGNVGVGLLYLGSAVAGIGSMFAFGGLLGATILGFSATGVGIVLVALAIVIAVLIEVFKDNKMQDWLERCYFGRFTKADQYQTLDIELLELNKAMEG